MLHVLRQKASQQQLQEMLSTLGFYIKLAVDIERAIAVGGGELHADCEELLLEDGSKQKDIWGADWIPSTQEITFEALINIRSWQNNFSMEIEDEAIRQQVERIARSLLGGV